MTDNELHWLAGLLEGEGYFTLGISRRQPNAPRIVLVMTDEDVVVRAANLIGGKVKRRPDSRQGNRKPCYVMTSRGGSNHVIAMMKMLRPLMGTRRGAKLDEIIQNYRPVVWTSRKATGKTA